MRVLSRRELGCADDFEGFVLFKESTPVAQFHAYEDYNTLFWLGHASLQPLVECLGQVAEEMCEKLGLPSESLSKGRVQYTAGGDSKTIPVEIGRGRWGGFVIRPTTDTVSNARAAQQATFARFDLHSPQNFPLILWGDLTDTEESEVGFSTTVETPAAVFRLLQSTCRVSLGEAELEEIRRHVFNLALVTAR